MDIDICPECGSSNLDVDVCLYGDLQEQVKKDYKESDFPREAFYCIDCSNEWFLFPKLVLFFTCYFKETSNLPIKNRIVNRDCFGLVN